MGPGARPGLPGGSSADDRPANRPGGARRAAAPRRKGSRVRVSGTDRVLLVLMVAIPLTMGLGWLPAIASVVLSFARWTGVGGLDTIEWIGTENYVNVFTNYPPFKPALTHNVVWLVFLFVLPTLFGMFLAVLLDRAARDPLLPDGDVPAGGAVAGPDRLPGS